MLTLIPRDVFVGDTAEIIWSFIPETEFLPASDNRNSTETLTISIPVDCSSFIEKKESCTVIDARVEIASGNYTVYITFIPWKPGVIDFPALNLTPFFSSAAENTVENAPDFWIDVPPITVASIIEKTGKNTLGSVKPPLLVPGTLYAVYGISAFVLVFLIALTIALVKIRKIKIKLNSFFVHVYLPRRARNAIRQLKKLLKSKRLYTVSGYSSVLSSIIRRYLSERFGFNFNAAATSEIIGGFNKIFDGLETAEQSSYMEQIYTMCVRLDYLRFSSDKNDKCMMDSSNDKNSSYEELLKLTETVRHCILFLEGRK